VGAGTLYLVGTPIGNLEDLTDRARRVLGEVDVVAAEDTRRTGRLLASIGVSVRLLSFFEGNEAGRTGEVVALLRAGSTVALVSDAGMPSISDPGYRLVAACVEAGFAVDVVPGPSAGPGGPAYLWLTWLPVLGMLFVALVFGELASQYPLAGALYQYSVDFLFSTQGVEYAKGNPLGLDFGGNWITGAALIAVLAPVYIFYGFESAGDISEETKDAGRRGPRAMRLEEHVNAAVTARPRGSQSRANLGGMVSVVVDQEESVALVFDLESTACVLKSRERFFNFLK